MSPSEDVDVAVVIGRFQFVHVGHVARLRQALAMAARCVVVLGSAFQARTPRRPLTWVERREMILLALRPDERERVDFLPMRDLHDTARWQAQVRHAVEALAAQRLGHAHASIALIGHLQDATSESLRGFTTWRFVPAPAQEGVRAAAIRDAVLGTDARGGEAALGAMSSVLAPGGTEFLRAWLRLPFVDGLRAEWAALRRDQQAWAGSPYPPVFVTVDAVVRCAGHVLLIVRDRHPGLGLHALPGGFLEPRDTLYQSAVRELAEETQLRLLETTLQAGLREVVVFDDPDRSGRGRTITHAHFFDLGERELPEVVGGDDAASARWVPIAELAAMEDRLHDDHFQILDHFLGLTQPRGEPAAGR